MLAFQLKGQTLVQFVPVIALSKLGMRQVTWVFDHIYEEKLILLKAKNTFLEFWKEYFFMFVCKILKLQNICKKNLKFCTIDLNMKKPYGKTQIVNHAFLP